MSHQDDRTIALRQMGVMWVTGYRAAVLPELAGLSQRDRYIIAAEAAAWLLANRGQAVHITDVAAELDQAAPPTGLLCKVLGSLLP